MATKYWALIAVFLVAIIATTGIIVLSRYSPAEEIVILPPSPPEPMGQVLVTGQVVTPGLYPFYDSDTIGAVIAAAGGTTPEAQTLLELHVRGPQDSSPQRIDINRAEAWLLEALPGIGETKARAIIDYREQNGPFASTADLVLVSGIGQATFEKIKDMVTTGD